MVGGGGERGWTAGEAMKKEYIDVMDGGRVSSKKKKDGEILRGEM
jgi:hypothetical protein